MTHTLNPNDTDPSPWMGGRLSGLWATLEVVMLLQTILHELKSRHDAFWEACPASGRENLYSHELREPLQHAVGRLSRLRSETSDFHSELGDSLLEPGAVCDVLEHLIKYEICGKIQWVKRKTMGFDRKQMIEHGRKLIGILRRSQAAVAAVHIAVLNLPELVWDDESPESLPVSDAQERQLDLLEDLSCFAENNLSLVRSLLKGYSTMIESLAGPAIDSASVS